MDMKTVTTVINDVCRRYYINLPDIMKKYDEPHRAYHTFEHIERMINHILDTEWIQNDVLLLAILFHDVEYNPTLGNNEEFSCTFMRRMDTEIPLYFYEEVSKLIMVTKHHKYDEHDGLAKKIVELDLWDFIHGSYNDIKEANEKIFKEYQFVDFDLFKQERGKALCRLINVPLVDHKRIELAIDQLNSWEPKIGLYAGSFNPFHVGHLNILEKAEKIFDKVIIGVGQNSEKQENNSLMPLTVSNRQIERYNGLLTDFILSLKYDVTLIRGIRNSTDLQYEQNQLIFLKDLYSDIKSVFIFCDPQYSHLSSTAVKQLRNFGKADKYLVK